MKNQHESGGVTDILFLPAAAIVSYVLSGWMPVSFAVATAVILSSLMLLPFEVRKPGKKRIFIALIGAGVLTFLISALNAWVF